MICILGLEEPPWVLQCQLHPLPVGKVFLTAFYVAPVLGLADNLCGSTSKDLRLATTPPLYLEDRNLLKLRRLGSFTPFFPSDNSIWGE